MIAKGLYKDIKDAVQSAGGRYHKSLYFANAETGGIDKKLFGGAVSSIFGGIGSAVKEMIPEKYKQKASLKDITSGIDDKDDVKDTLKRQKEDKLINQIEKMSKEEVESKFKNTDNLSDRVKAAINEKLGSGNHKSMKELTML